ncbi:hypothetical protein FUAX_20130 [Fulvitalea axinellae]|uniref:D-3-phosphoglycerate dehydrogenase n=1 Tax=Fulvitalea axinellae TaxID=1182444 RepID=A0AAU9D9J3_9BACT|nr:hypothetical protein FUAX_20130 [Fulvitalea axinellae]
MDANQFLIIDFDSTFVKGESLDILAQIVGKRHPDPETLENEIIALTSRGMDGSISFEDSIRTRLQLLSPRKEEIEELTEILKQEISDSFLRSKEFIEKHSGQIYIVSSGFKEFICPVVESFGIPSERVYANTFVFDYEGNAIGLDPSNPLAKDAGKIKVVERMNLPGKRYVVGDGFTDYEIRQAGLADLFFAFTENVSREKVNNLADHVVKSFEEVLELIPDSKNTSKGLKVLLLENVNPIAVELFRDAGYEVELLAGALDETELSEKIKGVHVLGIRSKTMVTKKVLENADKLLAIGAFCIGTNQINVPACQELGIAVFNAPYSNTRSVVELAIAEIILLMRNLPDSIFKMKSGIWNKSAKNSYEVRGKKLGIIGYGSIGSQLSILAEGLGMQVYYYDVLEKLALGNAVKCTSLNELLAISDVISLHVDGRASNKNLIRAEHFDKMKDGVIFVNLSRGHVVDIDALSENVKSGKVRGCAVDVFPTEPKTNQEPFESLLSSLPNTILTSHIGGSTLEAQINIANFVPNKIIEYMQTGSTANNVSLPEIQLPKISNAHRLVHIHENVPGMLAEVNQIFAKHKINVLGQYLKTNEKIGYMITSVDKAYGNEVIEDLKNIEGSIRLRVLY